MTTLAATSRENLPSSSEPAAKMQRTEVTEELRVRRLNEHAQLPKRGSAGAAGYDLARCGAGVTGGDAGPQCDFGEPLISCWSAWCLQPVPPLPSRRRLPIKFWHLLGHLSLAHPAAARTPRSPPTAALW